MSSRGLRARAHQSGDGISVAHCPFCGSGQVIGRSDGNTECSFCNQAFLVRVQPMYSAFPQSVDGQPLDIPGMPPADGGTGPAAEGAPPGAADAADQVGGGDPDTDGDDKGDDDAGDDEGDKGDPPPFAKKTRLLRTASGHLLTRAAYLDYLAAHLRRTP